MYTYIWNTLYRVDPEAFAMTQDGKGLLCQVEHVSIDAWYQKMY